MFFSFDGIDGVGKSTQVEMFCDALRAQDYDVVACRDPGSTALGERIRSVLLTKDDSVSICRSSEMLLYMAARVQLVEELIRPALSAGKIVVSDRFVLANIVYQGHAGGLDVDKIRLIAEESLDGIVPDCIFLLDMSPETAAQRMNRSLDRMEQQGDDYRTRLRAGYLAEAARSDSRIQVIDAGRPAKAVHDEIWRIASPLLPAAG